jgi:hypothetical protein
MKIFDWERHDVLFDEVYTYERYIRLGSNGRTAVEVSNWGNGLYTLFLSEELFPKLVCSMYSGRSFDHINDAKATADRAIRDQGIEEIPNHLKVLR